MENGGLAKASAPQALDVLLHRYDQQAEGIESEWLRWRHVAGLAEEDLWALESRRYGGRDE